MSQQEQDAVEQANEEQNNGTNSEANEVNEEEQFLVIRGHYKYGGRNKTYGILELIAAPDGSKFSYVDLGSSSAREIYDLFLDLDNPNFRDELKQLVKIGNTQDKDMKQKLRKNLIAQEIIELLTAGQEEQVQELIKEEIEDQVQEEIDLEINWGFLSRPELVEIYPDRFELNENKANVNDLEGEEGESLSTYDGSGDELNAKMKLNCSPVISAISGKLITSFDIGDEILVRITDNRDLTGELENKIKVSNGLGVGTIEKIEYKEKIDRYNVLVQLGEKIYGQLAVGSKVMLSYPESKEGLSANDLNGEANINGNNDMNLIITIVGLFIIIIILLLLYL